MALAWHNVGKSHPEELKPFNVTCPLHRSRPVRPRSKTTVILLAVWLASVPSTAFGRPAHKKALAEFFGPFLANRLNDCRTCHLPAPSGAAVNAFPQSKPHNPFGARLKAVKKELKKLGKPA